MTTRADSIINFCQEVLGVPLYPYQRELLRKLDSEGNLDAEFFKNNKDWVRKLRPAGGDTDGS